MEILIVVAYLLLGLFVGFTAGAFGIGGGVIMVPTFLILFKFHGFNSELVPFFAIGTSLFASVLASSSGTFRHIKNKNLNIKLGVLFGLFAVLASSSLSFIAVKLPSNTLKLIFAVILLFITVRLFIREKEDGIEEDQRKKIWYYFSPLFGGLVGSLSAFAGVGGGIIAVPILHYIFKLPFKKAIGTSNLIIIFSALAAAISYLIAGLQIESTPPFTLGYIYLLAGLPAGIGTIISAGYGAHFAYVSQNRKLKILFGILILLLDVKIFFDVLG